MAERWQQDWDAQGVTVRRMERDAALPLPAWETQAPLAAQLAARFAATADGLRLTHAEVASLNAYDARALGLPPGMDAAIVVRSEGRIDRPEFRVTCQIEPFAHPHPWTVVTRQGARIGVGAREFRLNVHQLALLTAWDALQAAGVNIAARLRAWPALVAALQAPPEARILLRGAQPHINIATVAAFPAEARQRQGGRLLAAPAEAAWAMLPNRRYLLRNA